MLKYSREGLRIDSDEMTEKWQKVESDRKGRKRAEGRDRETFVEKEVKQRETVALPIALRRASFGLSGTLVISVIWWLV